MKLIVGLGNPGSKYDRTRHNLGFWLVDVLVSAWKARGPDKKFEGEVYEAQVAGEKVLLAKPQTFMNLSGRTVGPLVGFYKVEPSDIVVIHDELDLSPGVIRFKTGGGNGGHNGLRSIDEALGAGKLGYHRVRIGIGKTPKFATADHVLSKMPSDELSVYEERSSDLVKAVELILAGKISEAMNKYHAKFKELPGAEEESEA